MSPRAQTGGVPDGARSKDKILAAAAQLAKERGLHGATIAAVSQRSGLPASSIYWHFSDKDALFAEVIRTSFAQWLGTVPQWTAPDAATLHEGLQSILGASTRTLRDVPDFLRIGMQVLLDQHDEHASAREAFLAIRSQTAAMITAYVRQALGPDSDRTLAEDLATLVITFSEGLLVGSQVYADWDPDEYLEVFLGMFDHAASSRAQSASRAG
ncbi:TetR/AcrR family transcriptional regulator [Pedococcus sp. 5OH_020]|uniref:TetR/AcrR family transcriptional regulator n=1 Tax=Pedococcus sp. 5OH_020 TaxID=2989814 RepID=UPI0022E9AC4E|nr:TetR/AcrR family transcriptional regulator [Pedococcus sp. 5OH_020]